MIVTLKMKLMMMSTYVIFMTNKTTNQTPDNLCNEVEKTTNVTQTHSGRVVKRPSRYDDYVMK